MLPLALKHLTAEDWKELDTAFLANRDPLTGHEPDDLYRPLFTQDRAGSAGADRARPCAELSLAPRTADWDSAAMKAIILAAGTRTHATADRRTAEAAAARARQGADRVASGRLARGGVREVVINTAWLEEQIVAALGDGARFGTGHPLLARRPRPRRRARDRRRAQETLPLLALAADEPFWYVAADVFAPGFDFGAAAPARSARPARPSVDGGQPAAASGRRLRHRRRRPRAGRPAGRELHLVGHRHRSGPASSPS